MPSPILARQYFLELWAAPGMVPNSSYPFVISIASHDGVVDAAEHAMFVACLSGPHGGIQLVPGVPCVLFDQDQDQDVDLADWAMTQRSFTEPLP